MKDPTERQTHAPDQSYPVPVPANIQGQDKPWVPDDRPPANMKDQSYAGDNVEPAPKYAEKVCPHCGRPQ
jgi:hypothetical protein